MRPGNPYAVSKAASDLLGPAVRHRLRAAGGPPATVQPRRTRPVGRVRALDRSRARWPRPRRAPTAEALLRTGDVSTARDFTDVRDVVRAYALAAVAEPGAYNVCSGRATRIIELIDLLAQAATVPVRHEVDPARLRSADARELRGSYERLRRPPDGSRDPAGPDRGRHARLVAPPAVRAP